MRSVVFFIKLVQSFRYMNHPLWVRFSIIRKSIIFTIPSARAEYTLTTYITTIFCTIIPLEILNQLLNNNNNKLEENKTQFLGKRTTLNSNTIICISFIACNQVTLFSEYAGIIENEIIRFPTFIELPITKNLNFLSQLNFPIPIWFFLRL